MTYETDLYIAAKEAEAVVIMTKWNEYRALELVRLKESMKGDIFIDLRDIYSPELVTKHGFKYIGVGVK